MRELTSAQRVSRRLNDKILVAFHSACDQGDLEAADALVRVAGRVIDRTLGHLHLERRRAREALVAAHERLWHLRHRLETVD